MSHKLQLIQAIISTGKLLWDKNLVSGFNGNISCRLDEKTLLITATGTSLGFLTDKDVLTIDLNGQVIGEGKASSERFMHTEIYKNLPKINCVVHTHTTYTNGFFLAKDTFAPQTFEAQFYLGQVKAIPQTTPSVTDPKPVVEALRVNNIVVLKNHGVVAVGDVLFNAFVLVQELEEQIRMDFVATVYRGATGPVTAPPYQSSELGKLAPPVYRGPVAVPPVDNVKTYKLFSGEQIQEIVRLVNSDAQLKELGVKTNMDMDLAVCLEETGNVYSFKFKQGQIVETGHDANSEFLITANETIWRAVFNREIDPFVATTQKKMNLRGDFARISKWYAPCSRIFQLWAMVPVK